MTDKAAKHKGLGKQKGVTGGPDGFKLRELANNVATIDVDWKYNLDQLADRLEELTFGMDETPFKLAVSEQSANRITAKIKSVRVLRPSPPVPPPAATNRSE